MPTTGYAYAWDVIGDPGLAARVRELGIGRVALAAAYHTTRAATPLHPRTRLVNARTAALYRPVRPAAWGGRSLVPSTADWVDDPDPFGTAATALIDAGIEVAPWIVLTHSTKVGEANPDVTVVNCFGEAYPYALCPQTPAVREYAATLAAESVRGIACSAVVLEACGQLGIQHGGHHEKTDGAFDDRTRQLLSICCCAACREAWTRDGLDPEQVVSALRKDAATDETLATLLEIRHRATDALRRQVIDAVRDAADGTPEIVLHGDPDPWTTGALPGLTPSAPDDVDTVVAPCWPVEDTSTDRIRRLRTALDDRATAGAYVTALPPTSADEFGPYLTALQEAGMQELHLYHLGLAGPDRAKLLAEATRFGASDA